MSDRPIRWGIVGTGQMASTFAADFEYADGAELVAVGSRSTAGAERFARAHSVPRPHGSYRALIDDPDVDVLYVATPHPQHFEVARAAIEAGKPVVIEKSFTATYDGTARLVELARERGVFLMEAMWTRFLPAVAYARELVRDGEIGDVHLVQADLGAYRAFDPANRIFDPALGGGATLDLGVYVVAIAQLFLGAPDRVRAVGTRYENGVDATVAITLEYDDGRAASLACSLESQTPGRAVVMATGGSIELEPRFHHPESIVVQHSAQQPQRIKFANRGRGYAHEIMAVSDDLRAGRTESEVMPLDDTLVEQRTLQQVLDALGITTAEDTDVPV